MISITLDGVFAVTFPIKVIKDLELFMLIFGSMQVIMISLIHFLQGKFWMEGNIDSVNNNRNTEVKDVSGETRDFDCGSEKSDNIQVKEEDDNSGLKKNASEG